MAQGSEILASDYNTIRTKVLQILGNGAGTVGYGQILTSLPVAAGNIITTDQWQALRNDIINVKLHQDGSVPTLAQIIKGTPIQFGIAEPNRQWDIIINQALGARFNIGVGRSTVSSAISQSRTGSWSVESQCVATVTFTTSDQARFFFNSGGKLRFTSIRTGGASTAQNNAWSNILNSVGSYEFTGNIAAAENFYNLTDTYKTVLIRTLSTPYSANFYRIRAQADVPNNSTGTARILNFEITWRDDYVDPGPPLPDDEVDGTLTINIDELKASGSLVPAGAFTIQSPTYGITPITAT